MLIFIGFLSTLAMVLSIWAAAAAYLSFKLSDANHEVLKQHTEMWRDFWKTRGIRMKYVESDKSDSKN